MRSNTHPASARSESVWLATNPSVSSQASFWIMCSITVHLSRRIANVMAYCIILAPQHFQFSLSVPSNSLSPRVFNPVLPFFLLCVQPYATNPNTSMEWPSVGVVPFSNEYFLILSVLLRRLRISLSAYLLQRRRDPSASTRVCLGTT